MIAPAALQMVLITLTGWLDRQERQGIAYLIEANRPCGVRLADGDYVSRMTIAAGWPRERTWLAVRRIRPRDSKPR